MQDSSRDYQMVTRDCSLLLVPSRLRFLALHLSPRQWITQITERIYRSQRPFSYESPMPKTLTLSGAQKAVGGGTLPAA